MLDYQLFQETRTGFDFGIVSRRSLVKVHSFKSTFSLLNYFLKEELNSNLEIYEKSSESLGGFINSPIGKISLLFSGEKGFGDLGILRTIKTDEKTGLIPYQYGETLPNFIEYEGPQEEFTRLNNIWIAKDIPNLETKEILEKIFDSWSNA